MRWKFLRSPLSSLSSHLIIGLISFLILGDIMDLPSQGIHALRRPRPDQRQQRQNHYHPHHHHHHSRRYHQRHHRSRRRNDTDAEIIPATVYTLDEFSGSSSSNTSSDGGGVVSSSDGGGVVSSSDGGGVVSSSDMASDTPTTSDNATATELGTAETIGFIRGFLPGLNFGGGRNKGKGGGGGGGGGGLFGGGGGLFGGGKGRGLFGGGGHGAGGGDNSGGKIVFPESPSTSPGPTAAIGGNSGGGYDTAGGNTNGGGYSTGGGNTNVGGQSGWSSGDSQKGKEAGSPSGGGGLFGGGFFKNPFGGGGGSGGGKGRGPFRLLSKLNSDQPCAAGLGSLPILSRIPFLPKTRFPSFIPSGVNTCDATCGARGGGEWRRVPPTQKEKEEMEKDDNGCTYNWRDSLTGFPFLLFRCHCKINKCPDKKIRLSGGLLNARCENVSEKKSRCKCPYGQQSFKCTLSFLPVAVPLVQRTKPYYCTCCNDNSMLGEPLGLGGYGGKGGYGPPQQAPVVTSTEAVMESQQVVGGYETGAASGGYAGGGGGGGGGDGGRSASENLPVTREPAQGRPFGIENIYEHLRRF